MTADLAAIAQLPVEAKRTLLAALARELISDQCGWLPLADAKGEMVLYALSTSPKATAEKALREADPQYVAELHRRAVDQSEPMSFEEAIELKPRQEASSQSL